MKLFKKYKNEKIIPNNFKYNICNICKHYNRNLTCKAFSDGIPIIIISGENNHSKPLKDQNNNIVFEKL